MRSLDSHKGQNGIVAVIGGSPRMHGAPIFTALAAQESGADLIHLCLPACHCEAAKGASLNFQVRPFAGDSLASVDTGPILELLATMDCCVIGPGIAATGTHLTSVTEIVAGAPCALVLDATALQPEVISQLNGRPAILTPHSGELERLGVTPDGIGAYAKDNGITLLLKGPVDRVASPDGSVTAIAGGNAGLTVGGTGDALAGLTAGLVAQGMEATEACITASRVIKRAGTALLYEYGYAYGAERVIGKIPGLVHSFAGEGVKTKIEG